MSKVTFPVTMGRSGIQMIENLQVYDFVWGTVNINRFCGMSDRKVNVAVHGLHCWDIARFWQPENKKLHLYALVHDLPEAYYGDIHGNVKKILGPDAKKVLDDIDDKVFSQLGLSREDRIVLGDDLHRIDSSALTIEAEYAFNKFQAYHWPPVDLIEKHNSLETYVSFDDVGIYNFYIETLNEQANDIEVLRNLLHSNRSYSHPVRLRDGRTAPCVAHAYQ